MKAAILAGGQGTRLRPITLTVPKALLPVAHVPILQHQIERIRAAGVTSIAACLRQDAGLDWEAFCLRAGEGLELHAAWEEEALGTGGAFRSLLDWLAGDRLFGINGDDLTDTDPAAMLARHEASGAEVTIGLRVVSPESLSSEDADPTAYGNVVLEEDGRITAFLEKPDPEASTELINAGQYVIDAAALERLPAGRSLSIEREGFPRLLEEGVDVRGIVLGGYHRPVNTAAQYLQVHRDLYEGLWRPAWLGDAEGHNHIGESCTFWQDARLGRNVTLGDHCEVGEGSTLEDVVAFPGVRIGPGARVRRSVLGPGVRVGNHADVCGSVLAAGTIVPPWSSLGVLEPGRRGERAT